MENVEISAGARVERALSNVFHQFLTHTACHPAFLNLFIPSLVQEFLSLSCRLQHFLLRKAN
jgi:hypothetical protein